MNAATEAQITALIVGVLATLLWRLIDRYLPDPPPRKPSQPARSGIDVTLHHKDTSANYDAEVHVNQTLIWSGRVAGDADVAYPDLLRHLADEVAAVYPPTPR